MFLNLNNFSQFELKLLYFWDLRNLQEQVKKAFCYQKLFWPFSVWINCSNNLKKFVNSGPSALNFKSSSGSLEQFFLTVGQNNFGNKKPDFSVILVEKKTKNVYLLGGLSLRVKDQGGVQGVHQGRTWT